MHDNVKLQAAADPTLLRFAQQVLRPLSRLFLRRGLNYHEIRTILAWSLVDAAMNDPAFAIESRRAFRHSISHAAAMTGMTRREAGHYADMPEPDVAPVSERTRRVMRVLFAWRTEPGYQDEKGEPRILPLRGDAPSFETLAEKERRDVPPRAIADLLVAEGYAAWEGRSLRLLPDEARDDRPDPTNAMASLAGMCERFLASLDHACDDSRILRPRFREVVVDDVPAQLLDEIRDELHARIERFATEIEQLVEPYRNREAEERISLGVGSFSFLGTVTRRSS